ncbi:hypothetical protein LEP1GSC195_1482 [Leptospira wolbachii serovar Codice str. CDC]|uniref:Outer membrane protein beta-barrel domain protein n=1 Tax=Leptospira wolbachii serovar Codice str. CDC TaxID=1218599 RepID=R9ADX7_9LEPT|nr:hypothetical protein [Leptospira wolbachii]EOQ98295.1 hypothetical protein LEP1GSC195_1482 [Leptospira wolbachii serovar Codice str. CDC]
MKLKYKFKNFTYILFWILTIPLYSEGDPERKKIHIYYTPIYANNLNQKSSVYGTSESYLTIMYGLFNNFYLGVSYNSPNKNSEQYFINSISRQNQLTLNRKSEYLTQEKLILRSQYFFWNNFYASINLGIEKGYKYTENLISTNMNNSLEIIPYQKTTAFSDRPFASIGLGYRKEFFSNLIIGTEFELGYLSTRKVNKHYTFDPGYSMALVSTYLNTKDINEDKNGYSRNYHFFSIYAGIAF